MTSNVGALQSSRCHDDLCGPTPELNAAGVRRAVGDLAAACCMLILQRVRIVVMTVIEMEGVESLSEDDGTRICVGSGHHLTDL